MGLPRFTSPKGGDDGSSPHLYVANCGPAVGCSNETIASVFGAYGEVKGVYAADESGTRVIVSYHDKSSSQAAMKALNRLPCLGLGGRTLHIQYSVQSLGKVNDTASVPVSTSASDLDIPGLHLMHDFVTAEEEQVKDQIRSLTQLLINSYIHEFTFEESFALSFLQELLAAVDERPWSHLAKRRVQHYGYEFRYDIRNVNTNQYLGELPSFMSPILERIRSFQARHHIADMSLDQITVNEYPPGVGLSPHIDTHSAFEELIFSLSLAGPCIMEFRKYPTSTWQENSTTSSSDLENQIPGKNLDFIRKALYLPPRSLLLMSGEARYAWHHYIPHHKVDKVNDSLVRRGSRRVSFTLRKVRRGPCRCEYHQYCDSQR